MSDNAIAMHVGVNHKTVASVRSDLGIPKSTNRTGADGRTINTANIGSKPEPREAEEVGEPETPETPDNGAELRRLRAKTVKTVEALMRAFDDLAMLSPGVQFHDAMLKCKSLHETAQGWNVTT